MEEYRIADVTPQKEQDGVSKAGSETREVSSATSSFTNLDQVRRGACKNYLSAAIDKFYDYCDFYFSSPLDITEADRVDLLHQEFGLTGLSNHHGTCYLNAALQFTAEVVRVVERRIAIRKANVASKFRATTPFFRICWWSIKNQERPKKSLS